MIMHVLLIENAGIAPDDSLQPGLQEQGYEVHLSDTPQTALEIMQTLWPNFIVFNALYSAYNLDSYQQVLDPIDLNLPYVIVADKNFSASMMNPETTLITVGKPQQLAQGIKKVTLPQKNRFLRLPGLILDGEKHQLLRNGQTYSLTPKEFKLLHLLASHQDQVVYRKTIMHEVWETDYLGDTRTLDVHIRWLREKIEDNPSRPRRIVTMRGMGYRFISIPD
jgi:DNA-binding winged helix-turn-helix (wHTH) protein